MKKLLKEIFVAAAIVITSMIIAYLFIILFVKDAIEG